MEIKGIITSIGSKSLTCCTSIKDVYIDSKSLYDYLDSLFNLDPESDSSSEIKRAIKYIILDEAPKEEKSLNSLAGELIVSNMVGNEYHGGCYSEYTCGYGGFDYVLNNRHSLFDELSQYKGKYIHLSI